jgi:mono/diheme cytochrome c family protein
MPEFAGLSEPQVKLLAEFVADFRREGTEEQLRESYRAEGAPEDAAEIGELVDAMTTPSDILSMPDSAPADSASIARGQEMYAKLGCRQCHEPAAERAARTVFFDDRGVPAPARDLVHDPFKGGHEPESIFRRLRLGMPGTAHPASTSVSDEELTDLVNYCRSVAQEPKRVLSNYERGLVGLRGQTTAEP